jgi:hypothetical protein
MGSRPLDVPKSLCVLTIDFLALLWKRGEGKGRTLAYSWRESNILQAAMRIDSSIQLNELPSVEGL